MREQILPTYGTYPAPEEELGCGEYEGPMLIAMNIGEITLGSFDREYSDAVGQYSWTKPSRSRGLHPTTDASILS